VSHRLAVLVMLLLTVAVALGNAVPVRQVSYEHEVRLAKGVAGYAFFTHRADEKGASLEALALTADGWAVLPNRVTGKNDSAVDVYCVPTAEVKKYAAPVDLFAAIQSGKVRTSTRSFAVTRTEGIFGGVIPKDRRIRTVVTVDKGGKLTDSREDVEQAPSPRKLSRLVLVGTLSALAVTAGGLWLFRRK